MEYLKVLRKIGGGYVSNMPRRRILSTWINYAIGVLIFLLLTPITGKEIDWDHVLLYFVGLRKVGNPTWYIMVILLCYVVTWISALLIKKSRPAVVLLHTIMIMLAGFVLFLFFDEYWYDTIFCYALGFAYSQYKNELEKLINKNYIGSLIVTVVLFGAGFYLVNRSSTIMLLSFNYWAITFAMLFVILGMKIKVGNKVINWFGQHLFPIYMYQGLFFHGLFNIGGNKHIFAVNAPFVYTFTSIMLTILLARYYYIWEVKLK